MHFSTSQLRVSARAAVCHESLKYLRFLCHIRHLHYMSMKIFCRIFTFLSFHTKNSNVFHTKKIFLSSALSRTAKFSARLLRNRIFTEKKCAMHREDDFDIDLPHLRESFFPLLCFLFIAPSHSREMCEIFPSTFGPMQRVQWRNVMWKFTWIRWNRWHSSCSSHVWSQCSRSSVEVLRDLRWDWIIAFEFYEENCSFFQLTSARFCGDQLARRFRYCVHDHWAELNAWISMCEKVSAIIKFLAVQKVVRSYFKILIFSFHNEFFICYTTFCFSLTAPIALLARWKLNEVRKYMDVYLIREEDSSSERAQSINCERRERKKLLIIFITKDHVLMMLWWYYYVVAQWTLSDWIGNGLKFDMSLDYCRLLSTEIVLFSTWRLVTWRIFNEYW